MEENKGQQSSLTYSKVEEPDLYDVVMLNDDFTTMDFVVDVLKKVFFHESTVATTIMLTIHKKGLSVVGTYSLDVAQSKLQKALKMAQSAGYPLRIKIQPHK